MAFAEILVVLAVVGVVIALLVVLVSSVADPIRGRSRRLVEGGRWLPGHEAGPGYTRILVRRVLGEQVLEVREVERLDDSVEDWDGGFHDAMSRARSRAATLNSEG